ncbi:MAG: uroporphyrinogen-III synthase [Bryobacterales bacterium]
MARDVLPDTLRARGATVDVVAAYETVLPEDSAAKARDLFAEPGAVDWVTFTSSSTVANLAKMVGAEALAGTRLASIGPVTSATLREHGLAPAAEAKNYTADGLLAAIVEAEL